MATASEFIESLPGKVTKEAIEGMETLFHFSFPGDGGGEYTVEIKDGAVDVRKGLEGEPKCAVKAKPETFMKVVNGSLNPMMAILTGKVKITNQGEMIKYAKVFGLMK